MMTLPPAVDRCLHKHTRYLLQTMVPDGVFVYLSGARLLDAQDKKQFSWAHDDYGKNHALLTIVAKNGLKCFEAFVEALEITQQTEVAQKLLDTVAENGKVTNVESIGKIKNTAVATDQHKSNADPQDHGAPSTSRASPGVYIVRPRPAAGSPSVSSSRLSRSRRTPLTPPLTEAELDGHLARLKALLGKIGTTHTDRYCKQEAKELLGQLDEAGEAMMDRLKQLSEENVQKERELRRAKYMVRGMENEIERLTTEDLDGDEGDDDDHDAVGADGDGDEAAPTARSTARRRQSSSVSRRPSLAGKARKAPKSKLCVVL